MLQRWLLLLLLLLLLYLPYSDCSLGHSFFRGYKLLSLRQALVISVTTAAHAPTAALARPGPRRPAPQGDGRTDIFHARFIIHACCLHPPRAC